MMQREVKGTCSNFQEPWRDRKLSLGSDGLGSNPDSVSYKLCVFEQIIEIS